MDAPVPPTDDLALFPRQFVKILTVIQIVCLAILVGVVGVELCLGRGVNFTIHPNVGFLNLSLGRSATSFFGCGGLLGVGVLVFYRLGLRLVANLNSRAVVTALAIYMAMSLAASLADGWAFFALSFKFGDFFVPLERSAAILTICGLAHAVSVWLFHVWANFAVGNLVDAARPQTPAPGGAAPAPGSDSAPAGEGGAGEQA